MQEEARGQSEGEEDDHEDDEPRERAEVAEARDVFGESGEDEDHEAGHEPEPEAAEHRSPEESLQGSPERVRSDDEGSEGDAARAEEIVGDDDRDRSDRFESDDERHIEQKPEKPMGPPIEIQVPNSTPTALKGSARPKLPNSQIRGRAHAAGRRKRDNRKAYTAGHEAKTSS